MTALIPPAQIVDATGVPTNANWWTLVAAGFFAALLWLRLFWNLVPEWRVDPQYAHGWFIPALAGLLVAVRCAMAPPVEPLLRWRGPILVGSGLLLSLLAPLAFLQAAYPEARPFLWWHAGIVMVVSIALLVTYAGTKYARYYLFPVLFMLLAVPWPRAFQNTVTDRLMHGVAAAAVEVTLLTGTPAVQQGNTITVESGVVGVDEACSGIRSLQGSLMVGLFLGSYFPMSLGRRALLLGFSVAASLLLNVCRASLLTWVSGAFGAASVDRLHDPAGLAILALVFASSLWAASWLSEGAEEKPVPPLVWPPGLRCRTSSLGVLSIAGVLWLVGIDVACHAWFNANPAGGQATTWHLDLRRAPGTQRDQPLSATTRQFLRYNAGESKLVERTDGTSVRLISLAWHGGEISAAGVRTHTPAICLPANGQTLERLLPAVTLKIRGVECVFSAYLFRVGTKPAYVYHAVWENGRAMVGNHLDQSLKSAILAVRTRRVLADAKSLLVMFTGVEDSDQAEQQLRELMDEVLVSNEVGI